MTFCLVCACAENQLRRCKMKWWKKRVAPSQATAEDSSGVYKTTVTKSAEYVTDTVGGS